jgi:hypothetical protein
LKSPHCGDLPYSFFFGQDNIPSALLPNLIAAAEEEEIKILISCNSMKYAGKMVSQRLVSSLLAA